MYTKEIQREVPNEKCRFCNYEWHCTSILKYVCCPSCRHGIKNTSLIENKRKSAQSAKLPNSRTARIEATSTTTKEADISS